MPVPEMERESQVSSKWSWARHLASLGLCFSLHSSKTDPDTDPSQVHGYLPDRNTFPS